MAAYATVVQANAYFSERLHVGAWSDAVAGDRTKALTMATRHIDNLDFAISKNDEDQENEFPRGDETTVPTPIVEACCEIALELLDGNMPDELLADALVKKDEFAGVRATYDRQSTPEHIVNGIVSAAAWRLLRPYLEEAGNLELHRVS